jgi:hypothetical protein
MGCTRVEITKRNPKLCLLSERSIRYIILSPRTPVFLPLPLRGKFSSDPRTRRHLRNLLRLNFEGYKKHPVCKKTTISPVNREKRKRFCRSKLMWTVRNHWNWRLNWSVISPKLCLLSERSIQYIILSPRTPVFFYPFHFAVRNYKTKFSVMF